MAFIGINASFQALNFDEALRVAHNNAFSAGMALRSGATAGSGSGSGSNFKVSGFSLGRHAMSSSSGDFQLSDVEPSVIANGQKSWELVDLKQMVGEREEIKAMLVDFLRSRSVSRPLAARVVNKSTRLITHLLSLLRTVHRARYLKGREPTTSEVRNTLRSFLENLGAQHKDGLVDVLLSFPDPPPAKSKLLDLQRLQSTFTSSALWELNLGDYPKLEAFVVDGQLRPALEYFLILGISPKELENLVSRYPMISSYSVEGKIKPVVDFLLIMGVPKSDVPKIAVKRPQLFGCSLDNIKPTVALLEGLGVEPDRWPKILASFPHILTYSAAKVDQVVKFLADIGMSPEESGRILTRFPHIVGYSTQEKLRPILNHFYSIGITDVKTLVLRSPQILGLSLEENIKPTLQFFTDVGYSKEEINTIILRFPQILGLNIEGNLRSKWMYFLQMGRESNADIVVFPQYFGYSLEKRIKPRYEALKSSGVDWSLNRMLSTTELLFQKYLERDKELVAVVRDLNVNESVGD
ncbi:transcription termination factor MTERF5, chloroplastic isoform X1 [Physcomitrium patens]|uniref:transcription termination factor MTERF5, chloroplastic isoform X1 n=1 Tax=Physcomitrium patens TaxID=3218 RepID=UPI000D165549|nr:transcription termination factor MTERF5, chloroplastic-like isoform X1 [Physcomitrium patens]|eukprot:XP_024397029.1 transcription termination factor MTERF5, chloroplastic-like isoform X1 [Physcomitrella patens]